MNVDDYRKAYAAGIEKEKQSAPAGRSVPMAAAAESAGKVAPDGADEINSEIAVFKDSSQPPQTRLDALQNVQTATFLGPRFDRYRANFRDALRAVAANDKNQELRISALELLALDKDEVARQLLLKGLEKQSEALVPVAKAVQLLAHDDHGVAIPIAQKVLSGSYDLDAKEAALRVLSSDPKSEGLFAGILSDRSQPQRLRSASATGLRAVSPQRFEQVAQNIIVNEHEDDDVRASCLGALNHMQGYSAKVNSAFTDALSKLDLSGKSHDLRTAAERYLRTRTPK
jgi:hypothetical protein